MNLHVQEMSTLDKLNNLTLRKQTDVLQRFEEANNTEEQNTTTSENQGSQMSSSEMAVGIDRLENSVQTLETNLDQVEHLI